MHRWLAARFALVLVAGAVSALTVVWGGGPGDGRDEGPTETVVTAPIETGAGRIDRAVGTIGPGADTVTVVGWVYAEPGTTVTVSSRGQSVDVAASQRRFDVVSSATGQEAWGFRAELEGRLDPRVCVEVAGGTADCAWFACSSALFPDSFRNGLEGDYPGQRFTAHVVDTRTGCVYALEPGMAITTASVVKLEILGGVLLDAQRDGRALTADEIHNIEGMMHLSLNPETGNLWVQLGGVSGMTTLDETFGATNTTQAQAFGATWSTAEDRTTIALAVLDGQGPLAWDGVRQAWEFMGGVHHTQQWGISAGVAEGFTVANKNGFYPMTGYGWRLGSTGFVADPDGGGYAVTVMTDNNANQQVGIDLVEEIATHVGRELTFGPLADRPFDDAECVLHSGGRSWTSLTVELGLPASDWNEVRLAAGGDGPLSGQLVCVP